MKSSTKKQYWWLIPLLFCSFGGLAFLSYNFLPNMETFTIRGIISGMSIILFIPLICGFIISVFICVYKILHKNSFLHFLKFCLISPALFITTIFIIGAINKSVPIASLDPHMRLNQYSQEAWASYKPSRRTYVEDLVENVLPGKNCNEIESLLGKSLDKNFANSAKPLQCKLKNKSELRYFLGSRGFFSDIDNIQIFFDEAGFYSHYEIYTYDF